MNAESVELWMRRQTPAGSCLLLRAMFSCRALLGLCLFAASVASGAQTLPDIAAGGSVLIAPFDVDQKTTLRVTNNADEDVDIHLVRVCGAEVGAGGQGFCTATDRSSSLTPKQTRVYNVQNLFDINPAVCPTGFVLIYAKDDSIATKQPISWNFLSGSVYVRDNGSGKLRSAGTQAISVQAEATTGAAVGSGGAFPTLPFTGAVGDFNAMPTASFSDFRAPTGSGVDKRGTFLHLMTLDIHAGAQNPPTLVALDWHNQSEVPGSTSLEYVCHTRVALEDVPGGLGLKQSNLGSQFGRLEVTPFGDDVVIGFIEEFENNRSTLRPLFHDRVPRSTTFIAR